LRDVAVINVNKRGGAFHAAWAPLEKAGIDFGDLIESQVAALNPQIAIFANCFHFLPRKMREWLRSIQTSPDNSFFSDGTIFIEAYHPAQTKITHEKYFEKVIDSVLRHHRSLVDRAQ
jgi:hypothetical protein